MIDVTIIEQAAPIVGERVLIRKAEEHDLEPWYNLHGDVEVMRYAGGVTGKTRLEWIEIMRLQLQRNSFLVLTCRFSGNFLGWASLRPYFSPPRPGHGGHDPEDCLELIIFLAAQNIGKGIGREASRLLIDWAFDCVGASCIVALVTPDNSRRLALINALDFCDDGMVEASLRFQLRPPVRA